VSYDGPIRVGMRFVWEPNKDHARERVEVTRVFTNADDEIWVFSRKLDGSDPAEHGNEADRFREAVIPVTEPYFERWIVVPVLYPFDEVPELPGEREHDTFVRLLADVGVRNGVSRDRAIQLAEAALKRHLHEAMNARWMEGMAREVALQARESQP
jgi:hypothetical protein